MRDFRFRDDQGVEAREGGEASHSDSENRGCSVSIKGVMTEEVAARENPVHLIKRSVVMQPVMVGWKLDRLGSMASRSGGSVLRWCAASIEHVRFLDIRH